MFKNFFSIILILSMILCLLAHTAYAAKSLTDEFDNGTLDSKWSWSREPGDWDENKTTPGWLYINADTNRNLWTSDSTSRLFQTIELDEFDVETHLHATWNASSVVAGLVVKGPKEDNWVTLKFWGHGDGTAQLQYQTKGNESGNGLTGRVAGFTASGGESDVYLRLTKDGDVYTGYFKMEQGQDWTKIGPTTFTLTPPLELGIYAGVDAASGTLEVEYEYFHDNINPLSVTSSDKLSSTWAKIKTISD